MRIGIFAKTFPGSDPETVLSAVRATGYSVAHYNMACSGLAPMPERRVTSAERASIQHAVMASRVQLVGLSGTCNLIHPDPAERRRNVELLGFQIELAAALAIPLVTLCTGTRDAGDMWRAHPDNAGPEAWADLLANLEPVIDIAERCGVQLGVEPELGNVVSTVALARDLIDTLASPQLQIVLDPANLFEIASLAEQHRLVAEAVDLLADRLVMAHAKDRTADGGFVAAGRGVLDFSYYLARLQSVGFAGPLITHGLTAAEAPAVAALLMRAAAEAGIELST